MLAAIAAVFRDRPELDRIRSEDLCKAIGEIDEQFKNYQARVLARLLKPFGIKPVALRIGDRILRGYRRADFQDAFARYLPPESATPQQSNEINDLDE